MKEKVKSIVIDNLSYNIGKKQILSNISLEINAEDFISIIGPNGAGKTTLIKCITNLLDHSGNIKIYDKNINDYNKKDLAKIIAYIPQTIHIDFDFTVQEIVLMGRLPYVSFLGDYSSKDYAISRKAMQSLNIFHLSNRVLSSLSGGEMQRVFLARAIAQNAQILVLDEAMSELDIGHLVETINILKQLNKEKHLTILSVMHDINIALQFFEKTIVLKDGCLKESGISSEVISSNLLKNIFGINASIIKKAIAIQNK